MSAVNIQKEVNVNCLKFLNFEYIKYLCNKSSTSGGAGDLIDIIESLDGYGFGIGVKIIERVCIGMFCCNFVYEEKECMKFICKELWQYLFNKQADRLQTNRRGGYVIWDKSIPWLHRAPPGLPLASTTTNVQTLQQNITTNSADNRVSSLSYRYDVYPSVHCVVICGIIRGVLANLGINSTVTADLPNSPACNFHIHINNPVAVLGVGGEEFTGTSASDRKSSSTSSNRMNPVNVTDGLSHRSTHSDPLLNTQPSRSID